MSGGSFDYLFSVDSDDGLSGRIEDIERMATRLSDFGHAEAARDTLDVAEALRAAVAKKERLENVWHAAEWVVSGDWGRDRLAEVVRDYTGAKRANG